MTEVPALEVRWLEVLGNHFERGSHIIGKSTFGISAADKHHGAAASERSFQENALDSCLFLVSFEGASEFVIAYLAHISRRHAEPGGAADGIGCASPCHIFGSEGFEGVEYHVSRLKVNVLHTALWKMECAEQAVVRQHGKNVGKCVSYSEYGFHLSMRLRCKIKKFIVIYCLTLSPYES